MFQHILHIENKHLIIDEWRKIVMTQDGQQHDLQSAQQEVQKAHAKLLDENQQLLAAQQELQTCVHQLHEAQAKVKNEQQDVLQAQEKLKEAEATAMYYQNNNLP